MCLWESEDKTQWLVLSSFNSLPRFSNETPVVTAGAGTPAPQAPAPFSVSHPSKCLVEVFVIHGCRSTSQGAGQLSPAYTAISSATKKDPQTSFKVPKLTGPVWLPPPSSERFSCDHKHYSDPPAMLWDTDQGKTRFCFFLSRKIRYAGTAFILSNCSKLYQFINLSH